MSPRLCLARFKEIDRDLGELEKRVTAMSLRSEEAVARTRQLEKETKDHFASARESVSKAPDLAARVAMRARPKEDEARKAERHLAQIQRQWKLKAALWRIIRSLLRFRNALIKGILRIR
jgi:citrate synthase